MNFVQYFKHTHTHTQLTNYEFFFIPWSFSDLNHNLEHVYEFETTSQNAFHSTYLHIIN